MKKYLLIALCGLMAGAANAQTLEERVEELEIERSLNYFKFSGDFTYLYDNIESEDAYNPLSGTEDIEAQNWQRIRFGLNVMAKPYQDVTFYSRFAMSKYVNSSTQPNSKDGSITLGRGNDYSGGEVFIEKAYFDYTLSDNLVLSLGRLPTHHGVPYNYHLGKGKMGTYPMMAYASSLDGVALTGKMDGSWGDLAARIVYTPFHYPTSGSTTVNQGSNFSDSSDITAFMLDYNNSNLGFADNLNLVAQHLHLAPVSFNDIKAYLGGSVQTVTSSASIGMDFSTIHAELKNIADTGIDVSVSHLMTSIENNGFFTLPAALGSTQVGYGAAANDDADGSATLLAVNYRSPFETIFGVEYLDSDEEYVYFDFTGDNLSNFYETRGSAYHLFVNHPFKPTLKGTLGYRVQEHDYETLSGLGAPVESDREDTTIYAQMRLDF